MELDPKLTAYIYSFESPAEVDFFTDKEKAQIQKETDKLRKTQEYLKAVAENPQLGSSMEKDIATGVIYSQGELNKVIARSQALEGYGDRTFPNRSLISPTGQRIIMSKYLADALGFLTDGYLLDDEKNDLEIALKAEGILENNISKVREAFSNYHAIIMQKGAFEGLFDLLSGVAEYDMSHIKPRFEPHGASLDQLKGIVVEDKPKTATKDIAKEVVAKELSSGKEELSLPAHEDSAPKAERIIPSLKTTVKPVAELQNLSQVKTVQDLKKIQTAHLRQGSLTEQTKFIKNMIKSLAQSNKVLPYYVVSAFEESPLFQTYLSIGEKLITNTNPDRTTAYKEAVEQSQANDQDVLNIEEFEAVADLRKQIEQL